MNVVKPSPSNPGDDLDGLLRAFLRSQLPHPWPPPRLLSVVASYQRRPALEWSMIRSRWTLAASVALLFLGSWLLPNRFPPDTKAMHAPPGSLIGTDDIRPGVHKNHRQKGIDNKNKPGLAADKDDPKPELEGSDVPMLD
jgi:hypothetical protein